MAGFHGRWSGLWINLLIMIEQGLRFMVWSYRGWLKWGCILCNYHCVLDKTNKHIYILLFMPRYILHISEFDQQKPIWLIWKYRYKLKKYIFLLCSLEHCAEYKTCIFFTFVLLSVCTELSAGKFNSCLFFTWVNSATKRTVTASCYK